VHGVLVANDDAVVVRQIFRLRADGASHAAIAQATGMNHSTVCTILRNRAYLGEVKLNGEYYPGLHEPLVSPQQFTAVTRGRIPGRRRGRDLMSGRVRCGLCGRAMTVDINGSGHVRYRCKHRTGSCDTPRRSAAGLLRAAVLGLRLIGQDEALQEAIRSELRRGRRTSPQGGRRTRQDPNGRPLEALIDDRAKLLRLHYDGHITADLFAQEERRLTRLIDAHQTERQAEDNALPNQLVEKFEQVAALLAELDLDAIWNAATEQERRTLLDEMIDRVTLYPDHLEVHVHGTPRLNVTLAEVGLGTNRENTHEGGPSRVPPRLKRIRLR
jgi:hypothetical protein